MALIMLKNAPHSNQMNIRSESTQIDSHKMNIFDFVVVWQVPRIKTFGIFSKVHNDHIENNNRIALLLINIAPISGFIYRNTTF